MKTTPSGPFLGINNRLPDFALSVRDKGDWLRDAVNVDIDNAGWVQSRSVPLLVQSMVDAHSLHMDTDTTGYLVRGTAMYAVTLAPSYSETLFRVLASGARVSWVEYNSALYYSSETDSGKIVGGTWYPMGMPTPDIPSCSVITGTVFAGKYQVAVSYTNSTTKEESGLSAADEVVLSIDGGIRVSLPASTPGSTHINVYVSPVNDPIPRFVSSHAVGTSSVDIVANPALLRPGITRYEEPLPVGSRLFMFNGQLCAVSGKDLLYGIPFKPGYCLTTNKRVPFENDIEIAIGNQNGVYVSAGKTYFMVGRQIGEEMEVRQILHYGAVPGTEFSIETGDPEHHTVGWFGENGIVFADTNGVVSEIMASTITQTPPASGVSVVLDTNDIYKVVSCGWCANEGTRAVSRYADWPVTSESVGYATMPDGVYLLSGGAGVDCRLDLGKKNFGTENKKALPAVYVGAASSEPIVLVITTPDGDEFEYPARSCSDTIEIHRIDPGKGLRENWYGLALKNDRGSSITLASASFAPAVSGRRI